MINIASKNKVLGKNLACWGFLIVSVHFVMADREFTSLDALLQYAEDCEDTVCCKNKSNVLLVISFSQAGDGSNPSAQDMEHKNEVAKLQTSNSDVAVEMQTDGCVDGKLAEF